MAVTKLNRFQTHDFQSWKGLTLDNNLGALFHLAPQQASNTVTKLLAANFGTGLTSFLADYPTKYFDSDEEYYWDVIASASRNIPLVEARDENNIVVTSTSGNVGAGVAPFYLVFAEDWFADGEVIVGNLNEKYLFRILGPAREEGTNYAYKVELMGGNTVGVPAERLLAGERFSVEYAPVEKELSRKVGDVRFTSPVSMRNEWTTLRIQHKVPGNKLGKKIAMGIPMVKEDPKTGAQITDTSNMWMHYVDWQIAVEWEGYKNRAMAFGRSNRNVNGEYLNFGKSGNVIRMGSGIFELASAGHVEYYNETSGIMKKIIDALYELSEGKLGYNNRKFIIKTGERGALLFNRAAQTIGSGWTPLGLKYSEINPPAITKTTAAFAPGTAVRITEHQITEWQAPNGLFVKLDVDPFYDDKVRNKIVHPEGGVAFSYRFDIWYIGDTEQPNIQKCAIRGDEENWGYEFGMRNPFSGERTNMHMSHDEDSATFHKMATFGALIFDPTRCYSLVPNILQ